MINFFGSVQCEFTMKLQIAFSKVDNYFLFIFFEYNTLNPSYFIKSIISTSVVQFNPQIISQMLNKQKHILQYLSRTKHRFSD